MTFTDDEIMIIANVLFYLDGAIGLTPEEELVAGKVEQYLREVTKE